MTVCVKGRGIGQTRARKEAIVYDIVDDKDKSASGPQRSIEVFILLDWMDRGIS